MSEENDGKSDRANSTPSEASMTGKYDLGESLNTTSTQGKRESAVENIQVPPVALQSNLPSRGVTPKAQQSNHTFNASVQSSVLTLNSRPRSPVADSGNKYATGQGTGGAFNSMANFKSLPTSPQAAKASMDAQAAAMKDKTSGENNGPEVMETPLKNYTRNFPSYTVSMDVDEESEGNKDLDGRKHSKRNGRHREGENSSSDHDIEFNSFALDLTLTRNNSFSHSVHEGEYTTLSRAIFHIFKGNVGAGVFLLPAYYTDAGFLLGGLLVLMLGFIMIDCIVILLDIKLAIDRSDIKTYPGVVGVILGDFFQQITKFSLIFTQFGFCIMFIQYASSIFSALFSNGENYLLYVLLSLLIVTPLTFLSNKMEILAYASMIAGIFVAIVLLGTTAVDIENLYGNGIALGVYAAVPTFRVIVFMSGHMFALEGIGVVLPVENSLAPPDRPRFAKVIKVTLGTVIALYITFGILGYMAYGETLHNSVVVALPPGKIKNLLQCLLGLSLLFGYPIQYVPAIQLVDKSMGISMADDRTKAIALRLVLNAIFAVCAASIGGDTLNLFASFLGAFVGVHLMITIPTLLGLQYENALSGEYSDTSLFTYMLLIFKGPYTLTKFRYYFYLIIGLFVWIGGIYFTISSVLTGE